MGQTASDHRYLENQLLYVKLLEYSTHPPNTSFSNPFIVFSFQISYQRFSWILKKRFNEVHELYSHMIMRHRSTTRHIPFPPRHFQFWRALEDATVKERGEKIAIYLESLASYHECLNDPQFWEFLEVGKTCFAPELGRKGKSGYLKKCSGGYLVTSSRNLFKTWKWRWVTAHDTFISYRRSQQDAECLGVIPIDPGLEISATGRYLHIQTYTRQFTVFAPTNRIALEWEESLKQFYNLSSRTQLGPYQATYIPRKDNGFVEFYHCTKVFYYNLLCDALMACHDICLCLTSAHNPDTLLTRPPLPPIKFYQLLRYKAQQGIRIYILISPQDPENALALKSYYNSLGPHVSCMLLTSMHSTFHQENIMIIDRSISYLGSALMSTGEYQDRTFQLTETEEISTPLSDYVVHPVREKYLSLHRPSNLERYSSGPYGPTDDRYSLIYRLPSMVITPHSVATILKDEDGYGSNSSHLSHVLHSALTKSNTKQNSAMGTQRCSEALPASHNPERVTVPNTSDQDAPTEEHLKILSEFTDEGYGSPETNEEVQVRIGAESFHTTVAVPFEEMVVVEDPAPRFKTASIADMITNIFSPLQFLKMDSENHPKTSGGDAWDHHCRLPSHATHMKVMGLAARDISSYFIRVWNFHRQLHQDSLVDSLLDITDLVSYGRCAKCNLENIHEVFTRCPTCQYPLGRASLFAHYSSPLPGMGDLANSEPTSDSPTLAPVTREGSKQTKQQQKQQLQQQQRQEKQKHKKSATHHTLTSLPSSSAAHAPKLLAPPVPSDFCFVIFECKFEHRLGCKIYGDGPVAIEWVQDVRMKMSPGVLISLQGNYTNVLLGRGLSPSIGDIIVTVGEINVEHLTAIEVTKTIKKKLRSLSAGQSLKMSFRRHYIREIVSRYNNRAARDVQLEAIHRRRAATAVPIADPNNPESSSRGPEFIAPSKADEDSMRAISVDMVTPYQGHGRLVFENEISLEDIDEDKDGELQDEQQEEETKQGTVLRSAAKGSTLDEVFRNEYRNTFHDNRPSILEFKPNLQLSPSPDNSYLESSYSLDDSVAAAGAEAAEAGAAVTESLPQEEGALGETNESKSQGGNGKRRSTKVTPVASPVPTREPVYVPLRQTENLPIDYILSPTYISEMYFPSSDRLDVCEIALNLSHRFYLSSVYYQSPTPPSFEQFQLPQSSSTCEIQVLLNNEMVSAGSRLELSFKQAWVDAIAQSKHLIYIENELFDGLVQEGFESSDLSYLQALVNRLLQAVQLKEQFRVIVVLPMYPEGDYLEDPVAKEKLQATQKGIVALLQSFSSQCPVTVDPLAYICFYGLRTWDVLKDKVMTEEIFVRSKVLIVDDQILLMGNSLITDTSPCASELGLRIVDSEQTVVSMGGAPFSVGVFPHTVRLNLMKSHVHCSDNSQLVDVCRHFQNKAELVEAAEVDSYGECWHAVAVQNTEVLDALEGWLYRSPDLVTFKALLQRYEYPSYSDDMVREILQKVKGTLVLWPSEFLINEFML